MDECSSIKWRPVSVAAGECVGYALAMSSLHALLPGPDETPRYKITRDAYHRMAEAGVFAEDERVELLDGELFTMSPQSRAHALVIRVLNRIFARTLAGRADVCPQLPFALSDLSEPEPDIALVAEELTPQPEHPSNAFLVIEVAYSSLAQDLGRKRRLYALAAVPEYWVIDVDARRIHVHRDPVGSSYQTVAVVEDGGSVAPVAFPDVVVPLSALFVPRT